MDPDATATIMRDESLPAHERRMAACDLLVWIRSGGFPQSLYDSAGKHISFGGNTAAKFAAMQEAEKFSKVHA